MGSHDYFTGLRDWVADKLERYERIRKAEERVCAFNERKERELRRKDPFYYVPLGCVPPSPEMDECEEYKKLFDNGCLRCVVPFRNGQYCAKWEIERNEVCKEILTKFYKPLDEDDEWFF